MTKLLHRSPKSFLQPPTRLAIALVLALAGCGGGGGSSATTTEDDPTTWVSGVFELASTFEALCAVPRTGVDPFTGARYPDRQGTTLDENNWLRSWSNDLYLWYDEIVDRNPALYDTPTYFELLKTDGLTPSGRPKDNFHFSLPTAEWQAFAQSGELTGYGVIWAIEAATAPREIRVGFVEPGAPAAGSPIDLARGARVLAIDGVDAVYDNTEAGVAALNAALFPGAVGETHVFTVEDPLTSAVRDVTLTSEVVTTDPVHNVRTIDDGNGLVGYLLFNDHIATAEGELFDAVQSLRDAGIQDLVLDLRYNSGGRLDIASELAYMIAGPARTAGRTFELLRFNDQHPTIDPVTGDLIEPLGFLASAVGLTVAQGAALPDLDLGRVFLLTGPETCSASESIMNALRGIGVEVIQIGATTCGKPYGFYPTDNCGTTYFTVQFQGVNDVGFGDYPDGFSPANLPDAPGVPVPGCAVADDFDRALGDPLEARFAAALSWRQTGSCPAPTGTFSARLATARGMALPAPEAAALLKPAWRQARVMGGIAP